MKKKQKKTVSKKTQVAKPKKAPAAKVASVRSFGSTGIIPLADRILVKPLSSEEKTTSFGLIIPDSAKEKPEQGMVVAVGPGKRTDSGSLSPVSVAVGDKVLFSKYGFDEVKVNGTEYYMIAEQNILAIIQ